MSASTRTCLNCGNVFEGKYCNQCGEKVYTQHDKSFAHIFEEAFHFLTHFEGSFLVTLKTMVTSPGKYSLEYCEGKRKKYFRPVSLFMLLVVIYLLFPKFKGLNMELGSYLAEPYGFAKYAAPDVKEKMKAKNISFEILYQKYSAKSSSISKITLFLLIPICALLTGILFLTSRKLLFDHFVLNTEILSFYISLNYLVIPLIAVTVSSLNENWFSFFDDSNRALTFSIIAISAIFIIVAMRRFFGSPWWITIIKAAIFMFIFQEYILFYYRLLVFKATMAVI